MAATVDFAPPTALPDAPVFVDPTGRRVALGRRLLILIFALALMFLIGLLAAGALVGGPDGCDVRAAVSPAASANCVS